MRLWRVLFVIPTVMSFSDAFSIFDILTSFLSPFYEHCDSRWVTRDTIGLEADLIAYVFGQHLATDVILNALRSHLRKTYHKKPLVFNFHGWPGGGKGYVAEFIVKNWYKNGEKSKFVKGYRAKLDFPEASLVYTYQKRLQKELEETINKCPRAIFVFDEVDKYPPHVLDGIKPYLDYNSNVNGYDFREAIFIFITNIGQSLITDIALQKWKDGVPRDELKLVHFEKALKTISFNEEGGFYRSDLIKHHLIDYVIPFLPLEKSHVESCIRSEFELLDGSGANQLELATKEIMEEITFGPPGVELYAVHGCKQIHEKMGAFLEQQRRRARTKNEL